MILQKLFHFFLRHVHESELDVKEDAWEQLVKGLTSYANQLATILDSDLSPDERKSHLNTLKMNVYLVCQFVDVFEAAFTKPEVAGAGKVISKSQSIGSKLPSYCLSIS